MDFNSSINLEACRFCLKMSGTMVNLNYKIKMNFMELMNEELIENSKLPQKSCEKCITQFQNFTSFKSSISASQIHLLNALQIEMKNENEKLSLKSVKVEAEDDFVESELKIFFEDFSQIVSPIKKEEDLESESERSESPAPPPKPKKKSWSSSSTSKRQQKTKSNMIKEQCTDCGVYIQQKSLLKHKVKKHHYPHNDLYICDKCGYEIKFKNDVLGHMMRTHLRKRKKNPNDKIRVLCKICDKMIIQHNYRVHMKFVHEKPVETICEYCGQSFSCHTRYVHHIRSQHTGERPFKCEYCDLKFYSRAICTSHMQNQHSNKESICHFCAKGFKNNTYLRNHIRFVHEERKIICEIDGCGMKFASNYKLKRHQTKHSELRKYVCKICDTAYKNCNGLRTHIRSVHIKSTYACEVPGCNSSYNRKDFLRGHIRTQHKHLSDGQIQEIFKRLRDIPLPSLKTYYEMAKNV